MDIGDTLQHPSPWHPEHFEIVGEEAGRWIVRAWVNGMINLGSHMTPHVVAHREARYFAVEMHREREADRWSPWRPTAENEHLLPPAEQPWRSTVRPMTDERAEMILRNAEHFDPLVVEQARRHSVG